MNRITLIGNLTKEHDIKISKNNNTVLTNSIAIYNGKDKESTFIKFKAFGKTAELIDKYTRKGSRICLSCSANNNNWVDKDGIKHFDIDFIVNEVEFLEPHKKSTESIAEPTFMEIESNEDSIPFN